MTTPPISKKSSTRVGTWKLGRATQITASLARLKGWSVSEFDYGFLLRGVRAAKGYCAQVIDFPGYLYFAGAFDAIVRDVASAAVPVGIRDDFVDPGTTVTLTARDSSTYQLIPMPGSKAGSQGGRILSVFFTTVQQDNALLGIGYLACSIIKDFPNLDQYFLDDLDYYTYAQDTYVGGQMTSRLGGAQAVDATGIGQPTDRLGNVQFTVSEADLPTHWKLYPRRIVPRASCSTEFAQRQYPGVVIPGFAMAPVLPVGAAEGTDSFCLATRTFRQNQTSWGDHDGAGFEYDRYGEQGLVVAVGSQDRSITLDPNLDKQPWADIDSLVVVAPAGFVQEYLRPYPEVLVGNAGEPDVGIPRPDLPNFGTFFTPHPVRAGHSFVVYSAYTTYRNLNDGGAGHDTWEGDAWSLLTTLPSGDTYSLVASWNAGESAPRIETAEPGGFMQPWIVGAASVPAEDVADGYVGYALVWEQTYLQGTDNVTSGAWALYASSGGAPTRTVMHGGAPLFALIMQYQPTMFGSAIYDISGTWAAVYYAGDNKLVTAATDYPVPGQPRDIRVAVIDVTAGTITLGGVIATRNDDQAKCTITVVQNFVAAEGNQEAKPAVLLASVVRHSFFNEGLGETYISVDGGANWRVYITDGSGQGGAFYMGNSLWWFDQAQALDGTGDL